MRLKTLRKERPAFENEGAVINGSRMDLSNSEYKPVKYRANNTFALPTSLNISPENNIDHHQLTSTTRRALPFSIPSNTSPYQAIEAAYLEHGIRIHLNPTTAAAVAQQQSSSTENLNSKRSENSLQRNRAFADRNPSRSSSALNYSTVMQETNQDSRPFSALQQSSRGDFDPTNAHNVSYVQPNENPNSLQLTSTYCSSSALTNEQPDPTLLPTQSTITNGTSSRKTLTNNDPDFAYMSSLLKTTSGDSYRDTIRRRAGLRGTFAVHRHPQYATIPNSKPREKSPVIYSSLPDRRNSIIRTSTNTVPPTAVTTPSIKKLEKDIVKHATRIRTNYIRDSFLRFQNSLRSQSQTNVHLASISNSPTRTNPSTNAKRNSLLQSSKSINLEPLELLLASPSNPSPPARATSMTLHNRPSKNRENIKTPQKRIRSPRIAFLDMTKTICLNGQLILNNDSLSLMKKPTIDPVPSNKTRQSNSFDSGYYDRSSSSDTHSITSFSINQASSSLPSARLTSASTRRSNTQKKVSFDDQSSPIIINTATYV